MFSHSIFRIVASAAVALVAIASVGPVASAQNGHTMSAVGPANQAMGGAGVAHPTDAIGAIHWNPASITALGGKQFSMGLDIFVPGAELTSSVKANAYGPGFPPVDMQGTTDAKKRIYPIPSAAFTYNNPDSKFAYGIGAFAISGFGVEYPEDPKNPVLAPQPFGFGRLESSYQAVQIVPTVAYKVTKHLSVGVAPTVTWHSFSTEPFLLGPRDDYGRTGIPQLAMYRPGETKASAFGIGLQAGVYYAADNGVELGFSYKSPIAFSRLEFEGPDAAGREYTQYFPVDYPSILSFGVGYKGRGRWGFAGDVRYIDYEGVNGFENLGVGPGRNLLGLGWKSIWATAVGTSYQVNSRLGLRVGYSFAQRAVPDELALYNVSAPTLVKHKLAGGVAYAWTESTTFHFTVTNNFEGSIEGPRFGPGTPTALGTIKSSARGNGFLFGLERRW